MRQLCVLICAFFHLLTAVAQDSPTAGIEIALFSGSALEQRGREQLVKLESTYPLEKWHFTRRVLIRTGVVPHSHPVLTLNTRYVEDDLSQLATYLHEQIHWFFTDHVPRPRIQSALTELRKLYPTVPRELPSGAVGESSTYLHLLICVFEYKALVELVGEQSAQRQFESWTHYTWVYKTVLSDLAKIEGVLNRHGINLPM